MVMVAAESVQERGLSAGMSETAAAHVEAVEAARREKRARPDDGTGYCGGVRRKGPFREEIGWQLGALHGMAGAAIPAAPPAMAVGVPWMVRPLAVRPLEALPPVGATAGMATPTVGGNLSFSTSNTEEEEEDMGKRGKRTSEGGAAVGAGSGDMIMMRFFEGLSKQVMERQAAMEQRFLEAIEKREQDRLIREEAWRWQETARLAREQEIRAQERAMAATRDAAVLSFIQKISGQTIPAAPPPSSQLPASTKPQASPWPQRPPTMPPVTPTTVETPHGGSGGGSRGRAVSSSRWTKAEADALIQLWCDLDMRRKGSKGWFWEEISAGMRRMGYSRSSKQCNQKWENMNSYFKKVKEGKKKRPEISYFHQLEALYRNKAALGSTSGAALPTPAAEHANAAPQDRTVAFTVAAPISQMASQPHALPSVAKNGVTNNDGNGHGVFGATQMQACNGGSVTGNRFVFGEAGGRAAAQKLQIGLKQAATVNSNCEVGRRADGEFRGVSLYRGRYLAQITEPARLTRHQLGIFDDVEHAARLYDAAALRLYGAAAKTNC